MDIYISFRGFLLYRKVRKTFLYNKNVQLGMHTLLLLYSGFVCPGEVTHDGLHLRGDPFVPVI